MVLLPGSLPRNSIIGSGGGRRTPLTAKRLLQLALFSFFLTVGCAHQQAGSGVSPGSPEAAASPVILTVALPETVIPQVQKPPEKAETTTADEYAADYDDEYGDIENLDDAGEIGAKKEEKLTIADPLEPFNRAMYHFNDRLYFWVLKPVAQGYSRVVPEPARIGVANFFSNLAFPIRFVNSLLQGNLEGAATELGRFAVNTLWGVGGFLDPASRKDINLVKQDEDFGQTLGVYGLGPGFFINWPLFGPSSPRDTLGMVGDFFLQPLSYFQPQLAASGARVFERVNHVSLNIGDYEALQKAAVDPYIAFRDVYVQYRFQKIKRRGGPAEPAYDPELQKQK